jgi:hypothetical protein
MSRQATVTIVSSAKAATKMKIEKMTMPASSVVLPP